MPTIDQLPVVSAVTDDDELLLSQNGHIHKATRAQVLAGVQTQLALTQGQLLGRASAGAGAPEAVTIGANLALSGGVLSASAPPLNLAALPAGVAPGVADVAVLGQGGRLVSVPYAAYVAGIANVAGLNGSALTVSVNGTPDARTLAAIAGDTVPVEAFGAAGDGVTDDSAAIAAAVASGRPVRFGPRTYMVNGQWTIVQAGAVLLGVPGATVLRRGSQTGNGAWIAVQADRFTAEGIIFDANKSAVGVNSWGVLVTNVCATSRFDRCAFLNAAGSVLGSGLVIQTNAASVCQHDVRDCSFVGNTVHGLWVQACSGVLVDGCRAHDNGQFGIVADFNDAAFVAKVRLVQLLGNRCWNNQRGISVGNYNATNTQPAVWGVANPDAVAVVVSGNICHDNSIYGIAASGQGLLVQGNLLSGNGAPTNGGAGVLANVTGSRIAGNMIVGSAAYGIDCGGSVSADVSANHVIGGLFGINCGGGTSVRVDGNFVQGCTYWAISVNNVETDGGGVNFGISCSNLAITGNWISLDTAGAGGIWLRDGPQNILVARNEFVGVGDVGNCLWGNTDTLTVEANRFNFIARFNVGPTLVGGRQQLQFPDIADAVLVTAAAGGVQSMVSLYQARAAGQVTFVRVTAGGHGYSQATVSIVGAGAGATATAFVNNGTVIGVLVSAGGSGYGSAVTVSINGDGVGATAAGFVGVPLPEERRLVVHCNAGVRFARAGSLPLQENWTGADIDVPGDADIEWTVLQGNWRAGRFPPFDYVRADGTGGAVLGSTNNGDVALHPNGSGHVRLTSDGENAGCISAIGRGSPLGVIAAPPGSDYRNLNGGAGATYWVKQNGTDGSGWTAVA